MNIGVAIGSGRLDWSWVSFCPDPYMLDPNSVLLLIMLHTQILTQATG